MKQNMGNTDRIVRLIVAGTLTLLWFQQIITGTWGYIALAFAGIFVLTSFISFCPIYSLFGISTCKVKKAHKHS